MDIYYYKYKKYKKKYLSLSNQLDQQGGIAIHSQEDFEILKRFTDYEGFLYDIDIQKLRQTIENKFKEDKDFKTIEELKEKVVNKLKDINKIRKE